MDYRFDGSAGTTVAGKTKLLQFAVSVIQECLAEVKQISTESIAMLLCVAEKERPGRLQDLDDEFLGEIQQALGLKFHKESKVFSMGRVSGVYAINPARQLLTYSDIKYCLIVGVDSLLVGPTLLHLKKMIFY